MTAVVDAHWDTFVQFFRRYPRCRRRKWYYVLGGGGGAVPMGEGGTESKTPTPAPVDTSDAAHTVSLTSDTIPVTHLPPRISKLSHQASIESGTPSQYTLDTVTAQELLLEVRDVAPLGAQLGVLPQPLLVVLNQVIADKCGRSKSSCHDRRMLSFQ